VRGRMGELERRWQRQAAREKRAGASNGQRSGGVGAIQMQMATNKKKEREKKKVRNSKQSARRRIRFNRKNNRGSNESEASFQSSAERVDLNTIIAAVSMEGRRGDASKQRAQAAMSHKTNRGRSAAADTRPRRCALRCVALGAVVKDGFRNSAKIIQSSHERVGTHRHHRHEGTGGGALTLLSFFLSFCAAARNISLLLLLRSHSSTR